MKYINKDKLMEWLRENYKAHLKYGLSDRSESYHHVVSEVKSGALDATDREILADLKRRHELVELGRGRGKNA